MRTHKICYIAILFVTLIVISCVPRSEVKPIKALAEQMDYSRFSPPQKVVVQGLPLWHGGTRMSIEEPFVSRDGRFLFFNSNEHENKKDLHYAEFINKNWIYKGETGPNINTVKEAEANPSMDLNFNYYYIDSKINGEIRTGKFNPRTGQISKISAVKGVPKRKFMFFKKELEGNMGVEITTDNQTAYFSRATWKIARRKVQRILASDLLLTQKVGDKFVYNEKKARRILSNINTSDLEYAASISNDELTLYFTRLSAADLASGNIRSKIMYATRKSKLEPFGMPKVIASIGTKDFVEGPSITGDGKELYYHKQEGKKFRLFKVGIKY